MDPSEGERRLRKGFAMVLDNLANDVLTREAFESALQSSNAGEIRDSFVSTFRDNCEDQFAELMEKHDLPRRLREVDRLVRTPAIHKKKRLKPLESPATTPLEMARAWASTADAAQADALSRELARLRAEVERERAALHEARQRAERVVEQGRALEAKLGLLQSEAADTDDEEEEDEEEEKA